MISVLIFPGAKDRVRANRMANYNNKPSGPIRRILGAGLRDHATSEKEHTTKRSADKRGTARRRPS